MWVAIFLLCFPVIVYLMTLPFSGAIKSGLRNFYRIVGGVIVFIGSGTSYYFAFYAGEQGGITAFYLQLTVIVVYLIFLFVVFVINLWLKNRKKVRDVV